MNNDIINRKLEAAKKQIAAMQNKINKPERVERQTVNTIPAGVPEHPPEREGINEQTIPGFITGGPRINKKMKEV